MRGYDISGALAEVAQSNDSKFKYVGYGRIVDQQIQIFDEICKEIEEQGRYKGVCWVHQGAWIVFKDENGKLLKNPRTYREPDLSPFIKGE